jgi:hypothetical protein
MATSIISLFLVLNVVEDAILTAVKVESINPPVGLERVWANLQQSYKAKDPSLNFSPYEWVEGTFLSYHNLLDLVSGNPPDKGWVKTWEAIQPFRTALENFLT